MARWVCRGSLNIKADMQSNENRIERDDQGRATGRDQGRPLKKDRL